MCGIVGVVSKKNSPFRVRDSYLTAMRDTMHLRGPDGGGNWISPDEKVGLGHRRLSIIDLSSCADQPMSNEDLSLFVVFNGEIYNHEEIRAELSEKGEHQWKTDHSDTEVILHAFEEWGIECVKRFRGMFAFALWDTKTEDLWLVRDRAGIKPLYYSSHHGRLVFASEIKALLKDPEQSRSVNETSLFHYLSFLATPAPETFYEGIRKLPAATWLRIRDGRICDENRYWDALEHAENLKGMSEDDIAERLLAELRQSVKLRKISDVPVGVFLSGGVDSSANAAFFSEGETGLKSFTIGYQGDYKSYSNETEYARQMARVAGTEHHELLLTQNDLIEFLPQMIHLQDEPIADPVCVPVYYVSKLARDHGVVVCHVGEGADELFFGYPGWKRLLDIQNLCNQPVPSLVWRMGVLGLRCAGKGQSLPCEWIRRASRGGPVFWGGEEAFSETKKSWLLSSRMRRECAGRSSWEVLAPIYSRFLEHASDPNPMNWMTYLDLNFRLPELLLMRVDKMSMGVSLEGRVPFLDHKLIELAMGIPPEMKIREGKLKYILKKAVRGHVPDALLDRAKQGFGVPVYEWFMDRLGTYAQSHLEYFCQQTDYLDRHAIQTLFDQKRGKDIWYLLNVALWWKYYIAGEEL